MFSPNVNVGEFGVLCNAKIFCELIFPVMPVMSLFQVL